MEIIEFIKEKFQVWYLIQRDKYLKKELAKIPSDNPDDYYFDTLTNQFVYKDTSLNIQIGWENTLNVIKTQIESVNISAEKLEAIINDIAQVNVDTSALTAIIANIGFMNVNISNLQAIITDIANIETQNIAIAGNIGTMNTNITNLQAIITDIANIETQDIAIAGDINSLTAIIANIGTMNTYLNNLQAIITDIANIETQNIAIAGSVGTMNTNITNLQAIITDIANIETLNTTISGNITSLTAIIANIGTMNTNIGNLQAIISDIANIETQNIAMNTALASINTNIGSIETAITNINAINAEIEINIEAVKDLDIEVIDQSNKGIIREATLNNLENDTQDYISNDYLYNRITVSAYNNTPFETQDIDIAIRVYARIGIIWELIMLEDFTVFEDIIVKIFSFHDFPHIRVDILNNHVDQVKIKYVLFFSKNSLETEPEITLAKFNAVNAIGIENKRWINLSIQHGVSGRSETVNEHYNSSSSDMYLIGHIPISYIVDGNNLVITRTQIGVSNADGSNYVDVIYWYGTVSHLICTPIMTDGTNRTTPNLYTYNHSDIIIGGNYNQVLFVLQGQNPTGGNLGITTIKIEYYYAES